MKLELFIIVGPDAGRRISLVDGQTLTIGRSQSTLTQLTDPRVSRTHCLVQVDGGQAILIDSGSTAGTLLNGTPIKRQELRPGDVFCLGDTQIRFQLATSAEQSTLQPGPLPPFRQPMSPQPPAFPIVNDLIGQSMSHFRLDRVIHKSESGLMFLAHDTKRDRPAAVKVLSPETAGDEAQKQRFVRAMQTMIDIRHENLVELYGAGKQGSYCWFAMEHIDGQSLREVIHRMGIMGMLDWQSTWRVAVHVARALEAAYEHQIIHRNVTPENILQRRGDNVCKLGNLMLAKALSGTQARQVTRPGQIVGDLSYLSPERTRDGVDVDCRSDIYSLGATLYALLTGRAPFESHSLPELIRSIRDQTPTKPKTVHLSVDDRFQDLVMHMLAKRPEDRFQTPALLLKELLWIGKLQGLSI
ncbi:MAG: protein kinase [Pirellulales bacterium]